MSLFDVIKYRNINLTSQEELETLPIQLIELYWHNILIDKAVPDLFSICNRCKHLSYWARTSYDELHEVFIKTLEEYNI